MRRQQLSLFAAILALLTGLAVLSGPEPAVAQTRAAQQEALLSGSEKEAIQEALVWTGHYDGSIDGLFGPGTRAAISNFQRDQGFRPTGYLRQRHLDRLMAERDRWKRRFGWEIRRFPALGLEVGIPAALFGPAEETPVGLRFRSKDDQPRSELILYSGLPMSEARFDELREEVVDRRVFRHDPYDAGNAQWFVFSGTSDKQVEQYTYVVNRNVGTRGFSFRYMERHDAELSRLNTAMYNSLRTFPAEGRETAVRGQPAQPAPEGDTALFDDEDLQGLFGDRPAVREEQPAPAPAQAGGGGGGTGFIVNRSGAVLTTAETVDGCGGKVRVNGRVMADVGAIDRVNGLALVRLPKQDSDLPYLKFRDRPIFTNLDLRVLEAPRERDDDLRVVEKVSVAGLTGRENDTRRFRIAGKLGRDGRGAPIIDREGQVVGLVVGRPGSEKLAEGEHLAMRASMAQVFLQAFDISHATGPVEGSEKQVPKATRLATVSLACAG